MKILDNLIAFYAFVFTCSSIVINVLCLIHIRFVKYSENTNSTLSMPVYLLALRFVKFYNVYRPPCH